MGFPTHLLADDEQLVLVLRRHIKVIAWPILLLILILALIGASFLIDQPILTLIVAALGLIVALRWVLWPILKWWNEIYVLTTKRLILRQGVFNRSGHDMPLSRLNEVSFEHSLFERMLGCGTLKVENASEGGPLVLTDIPKVEVVQRSLYELADDLRGVQGRGWMRPSPDLDDAFDGEYQYRGNRAEAASDTPEDPGRRRDRPGRVHLAPSGWTLELRRREWRGGSGSPCCPPGSSGGPSVSPGWTTRRWRSTTRPAGPGPGRRSGRRD